MDRFASVTDQQLVDFFEHQIQSRRIMVNMSRAMERRLRRSLAAVNRETPDDPFDSSDGSLAIAIIAACDRGLQDAETDDGVWAGIDGTERPLPRRVRAPIIRRAKFSWRAARNMWRST